MPSRLIQTHATGPYGAYLTLRDVNDVWYHSARRPDGTLELLDNAHSRQRRELLSFAPNDGNAAYYLPKEHPWPTSVWPVSLGGLENETYARIRGKLYKGSAALGVTIGSWKQSREMIVTRYRQMSLQSDSFERHARRVLEGRRGNRRIRLDKLGSQYLEMVFGWKPLLADIHAAAKTVIDTRPQTERVTARAAAYVDESEVTYPWVGELRSHTTGVVRVCRGATVEISNPNLWLRERAGLNNPGAVAWDLVPWSFVVNMFANTGTLVNSITDFAGLSFPSSVIVRAYDLKTVSSIRSLDPDAMMSGSSAASCNVKFQVLGGVSRPPLVFKLPGVNWELAGIAASLFFQKFTRVSTLVLSSNKPRIR